MRVKAAAWSGACVLTLLLAGCGGGSSSSGNPSPTPTPTPTPKPTPTGSTVTINGDRGNQSFSPNPAGSPQGGMIAWSNADGTTHHIVANDNSFDTGPIPPGATTAAVQIPAAGINYHCTIHPGMVGAVAGTGGNPPPCSGLYCAQAN